ncbi:pimeloyl-ACP methyl ester carboxylesterase [Paenibacillus sp. 1182]|uniref:alpha/beta fold hydrolase n=1 Tax=Paenibacillus sp. 1182 TaxID=2806565 RepID=UPI001AE1D2C3|nr:alpha/beta hydrolase [Paenibacillus sp. 1182]MBP1309138.1 pimeloyl-ACP methyl ester carboxylesterase [Paenibacillus sp. 1182]
MKTHELLHQEDMVWVNEQGIAYTLTTAGKVRHASATTFLLVHGAMMNSLTTAELAKELAVEYPAGMVCQVDLPGHGHSIGKSLQSISDIASVLKLFITDMTTKGLFTENLVLVGHSMGGSICMQLMLDGVKAKQLILLSSAPEWKSMIPLSEIPNLQGVMQDTFEYMMMEDFKINISPEEQSKLNTLIPRMMASSQASIYDLQAMVKFDLKEQIVGINVPVLVVYGDNDSTAALENQNFMINTFTNVSNTKIAGATHTTVIKNVIEVLSAIKQFLERFSVSNQYIPEDL